MSIAVACVLPLGGFVALCYTGSLLMRLVMVQPVETPAVRILFASSFALSVSLLVTVLVNTAAENRTLRRYISSFVVWHGTKLPPHQQIPLGRDLLTDPVSNNHSVVRRGGWQTLSSYRESVFQDLLIALVLLVTVVAPLVCGWLVLQRARQAGARRRERLRWRTGGAAEPFMTSQRLSPNRTSWVLLRVLLSGLIVGVGVWCGVDVARVWRYVSAFVPPLKIIYLLLQAAYHTGRRACQTVLLGLAGSLRMPSEIRAANVKPMSVPDIFHPGERPEVVSYAPGGPPRELTPLLQRVLMLLASQLATLGVSVIGLLAGYAAISTPQQFLIPYVYYRRKEDVLGHAREQLAKKQRYLLNLQAAIGRRVALRAIEQESQLAPSQVMGPSMEGDSRIDVAGRPLFSPATESSSPGLWARLRERVPFCGDADTSLPLRQAARAMAAERQHAEAEVQGIRHLSLCLFLRMDVVNHMLQECHRGRTAMGKAYALCGMALALYTAVKVVLTVASLLFFPLTTQDPVTRTFALLETCGLLPTRLTRDGHDPVHGGTGVQDPAALASWQSTTQAIIVVALVVNGWMVVSSIRGLLLLIFQLTLSVRSVVTADTTAVALTILMGVYFIGQLVMLRQSLPRVDDTSHPTKQQHVLFAVLGPLPTYFYQRLYDWCFLAGCGGTLFVQRFVLGDVATSTINVANG